MLVECSKNSERGNVIWDKIINDFCLWEMYLKLYEGRIYKIKIIKELLAIW